MLSHMQSCTLGEHVHDATLCMPAGAALAVIGVVAALLRLLPGGLPKPAAAALPPPPPPPPTLPSLPGCVSAAQHRCRRAHRPLATLLTSCANWA